MGDAAATNVRPYIHHVDGHDLCRVQVDPCAFPVPARVIYQKPGGTKEARTEFFVRVANGTRVLDAVEREKYVLGRWGSSVSSNGSPLVEPIDPSTEASSSEGAS